MGTGYGTTLPRNDLSLLLDPSNIKSYPGSGTIWYDVSGNNNHAILSGAPVFLDNKITFDGIDDHATITANQTSLNFELEQTVIIWMYHTYTSGRKNPWDQAYGGYGTWTHENGATLSHYYGDHGGNAVNYVGRGSSSTPTGVWNMMSITRNTTIDRTFKNGIKTTETANPYGAVGISTADIRIGVGYAGRWVGDIRLVMAYKRSITEAEMLEIFNNTKGRFV